ncbi:thiol:disulfide interchange protein DsbC [Pseudogulbenkiania sp. NH8B]|uniref:DsbC family protein n=1 Tax=Pseudogulbenkiania sp. (strain NH8B) TaxID=748280 RepID=UPI0002279DBE|nr:DsbC family protein [Pseudogulbenkiania sp. NH8B]BAK76038.1 thiol:disulfide interchange protein DsbC [Pseudogulbenkiania sp. NH8B]
MNATLKKLALAALLLSSAACVAKASDPDVAEVKKAFVTRFPDRKVESVSPTPVSGLYEVVLPGRQIVYVDAGVKHLFVGDLIDAEKRESLTEKRVAELSKVAWKDLPLAAAMKEVRGSGARKVAIFSDPDCPFCKKLERETLKDVNNVTIYTFLYPLTQLHPDAMRKSRQIWCSKDRVGSWTAHMRQGTELSGPDNCDVSVLEQNQALGAKLGINGTPTMVFGNGRMVSGAIPSAEFEKYLSAQ